MKDIKQFIKNPLFYYVLVPAMVALWPVILWGIYLPAVRIGLNEDISQYEKAMQIFEDLRNLDPDRLNESKEKNAKVDFDYATAVQQTAAFCSIASPRFSSGTIVTSQGQKSQSAAVSLKDVDVTKAMRFLSTIQLRWSSLQCTQVTLKKKKGLPDSWDVDFAFKYFY
jgi:hypothetical protein